MLRVVMTTTLVALLLSCTALLLYELNSHRNNWAQDLRTQADLVARVSLPALLAGDADRARGDLALLRLRPQIEGAALYDAQGRLFASYGVAEQAPPPATLPTRAPLPGFQGERFELRQPVEEAGRAAGTIVMQARYHVLPRLWDYLRILGAVMLASLALAALVARQLQRAVTEPIVAVSEVAREVVLRRNFALRAPRTTDDEVGALVDAFNDMLRELGEQAAELQATDRRKDEFLATLAHELRNPLAPVATALAILERGDADAATQQRLVAMMQRQMQQFVRLIDDLMEVSRISTGRLEPRLELLDLVPVLRGAVESVAPALLERRHALIVDWPDEPLWVEGDRTRLGQVFANLLGNAAKYTPEGGRVSIAFTLRPDRVAVHIRDNGIGVAPEMQGAVFEMFVQVDRRMEGGRSGLGVGLSLARQLVALHQGTLTLHSAGLGQGSTFTVRLPLHAPPPAAPPTFTPQPRSAPTAHAGPGLHVLVADDNRDFADSLAAMLGAVGHRVELAYDGPTALHAAQARLPDVGLFDVGMPGLDGYALAREVRRQPGGDRCLLVAITGWGQPADRQRAQEAGYDEHLVKPVDLGALEVLLARHPQVG